MGGGVSERTKSHKSSNEKVPINGFVLDVVCATRTYMCTIYKSINVPVVLNDLFFLPRSHCLNIYSSFYKRKFI